MLLNMNTYYLIIVALVFLDKRDNTLTSLMVHVQSQTRLFDNDVTEAEHYIFLV